MAQPAKAAKPNVFARLGRYLRDVRAEMGRVVWPSRAEVVSSSGIVITTLVLFIVLILIYDQIALRLVQFLGTIGG